MMKYIKESKRVIFAFILGAIIFGTVGVYAGSVGSSIVTYSRTGTTVSTVEGALNDLYTKASAGNATAAQILTGKTALVGGKSVTGTMTNQGAVAPSALNAGGSYTIPAGYHNGSGKVTANSLANQTKVDSGKTAVTAATMLTGYQGWVNGSKISGTMANQGAKTSSLNAGGSYTIPAGYHNGSGKITANSLASQTGVDSGKTAISAGTVLSGYQGWVNGSKISGTIASRSNGSAVTNYGVDSTGPYVYFSAGYWPANSSTYGSYVRLTAAQVKSLANSAGVGYTAGYNAGVTDADARANTSSANYKAGYNAGYSAGQSTAHGSLSITTEGPDCGEWLTISVNGTYCGGGTPKSGSCTWTY